MTEHRVLALPADTPPLTGAGEAPPHAHLDGDVWHPPRCYWLPRVLLAGIGWFAFVLLVRLAWGGYANWCVAQELAAWRHAGAPTMVAELYQPPDEAALNAGQLLREARSLALPRAPMAGVSSRAETQPSPEARAAAYEADCNLLQLVRRARAAEFVQWNQTLGRPLADTTSFEATDQRLVAFAIENAVAHLVLQGEYAEAVETLRDLLAHARATSAILPLATPLFLRSGREAAAIELVERLAHTLRVAPDASATTDHVATPAQVSALIADLLNQDELRAAWLRGLAGERVAVLELACLDPWTTARRVIPQNARPGRLYRQYALELALAPARRLAALDAAREAEPLLAAIASSNWGEFERPAANRRGHGDPKLPTGRGNPWELARSHFRCVVGRRLAAIGLAARLYEQTYGEWPVTLEELAPWLGGTVPADPCSPSGAAVSYVREPERVFLYSVWLNGRDDGGATVARFAGRRLWSSPDFAFSLAGELPLIAE